MTFGQIFAILRARWKIAAGVFATILGAVAIYTFLIAPRVYSATATVLINSVNPDPIQGGVAPGTMSSSFIMTQVDVLTSGRVAQKVVDDLKYTDSFELKESWRRKTNGTGDFRGWVADLLAKNLEVRPSRGSNVISVSYYSDDPRQASTLANAFVQAYLETTMELRTDPAKQFTAFFEDDSKKLRANLDTAQQKLSEFQLKNGLIVTDERLDVETARLNELSSQYVQVQAALAESGSHQAAANSQGQLSPDIINNPLISSLKGDIIRQQAALDQLSQRLGSQNPQVIEAKANISDLQNKLNVEIGHVTSSVGVGNSINASRAAQLRTSLDEQRSKLLKMKALRDQASLLIKDVENAQRSYDGVMTRLSMSTLESKAQEANVSALQTATAPSDPTSPKTLTNLALAAVAGGILALAAALITERYDRRLRTVTELEPMLQLPVLAVVPAFHSLNAPMSLPKRLSLGGSDKIAKLQAQ